MELAICNFDISKHLKEIGFDWKCLDNYHIGRINGKNHVPATQIYAHDWNNKLEPHRTGYEGKKPNQGQLTTSAPTLALVQMWLEEVHGIFISFKRLMGSQSDGFPSGWHYMFIINGKVRQKHYGSSNKALENGILEAIKLIKTKQDDKTNINTNRKTIN